MPANEDEPPLVDFRFYVAAPGMRGAPGGGCACRTQARWVSWCPCAPVHLAPARPHVNTHCPRPYFLATAPRLRVQRVSPSGRAGSCGLGRVPSSRLTHCGPRSTPPLEMRLSC